MAWVVPLLAMVLTQAPVPPQYRGFLPPQPKTWTAQKARLGKQLFFDKRLSKDSSVSCASCHDPAQGFSDGRPLALGIGNSQGPRNTPTVVNRAFGTLQFWDGRAASLEEQALGPIANPLEMNLPVDEAVARLKGEAAYRSAFKSAFGGPPTAERLAEALASYQRTIYSVGAPYDRFDAGDGAAMSESAIRGLDLFGGKAHCGDCHAGPNFTDELFHTLGTAAKGEAGRATWSKNAGDQGAFKTPTLRELTRTGPYMHDGSLKTLADVVEFYDKGCSPHSNLDKRIKTLGLTVQEKADLVAFLEALTGSVVEYAQAPAGKQGRP